MDFSNIFQLIEKDRYLNELHSHINYQSLRTNDIIQIDQHTKNQEKNKTSEEHSEIFFEMNQKYLLPRISQGIILIKQNYESMYKSKNPKQLPFRLKEILIKFYAPELKLNFQQLQSKFSPLKQKKNVNTNPLSILIEAQKITLFRQNKSQLISEFKNKPIFPSIFQEKRSILQRRIWLQINKKINRVSVHTGDLQSIQNSKTIKLSEPLDSSLLQHHFDWKHCVKIYSQNKSQENSNYQQEIQNPLLKMTYFRVFVKLQSIEKTEEKNLKNLFNPFQSELSFKFLDVQAKRQPQLKQIPSILEYDLQEISSMPNQIKSLFVRFKGLNLLTLCPKKQKQLKEQTIANSIHHSLVTSSQIFGTKKIPIGILNHVLKMKTGSIYTNFIESGITKKSSSQMYSDIANQRVGYIRFKICCPKGHYPGSPAIMQIWPPFYSSPIHNHGQAFGLVKVLMGQIQVQNFQELSLDSESEPYLKTSILKDQYTWLSQNSFGIHRIMNLQNQTAVTLQGYYDHQEGLDQYFSFIHKNPQTQKKSFAEYYPQHDWKNFLNKASIENKEDRDFIERVIEFYDLKDQETTEIDCTYEKFIEVLIKEYNAIKQAINDG